MAINFFNNLQVNKGYIEINDGGTANQRGIISYGVNGKLGSTTGWTPDANNHPGLWVEGSNDGESGGIFMNGNACALWSPGDQGIFKIYDEDNFSQGPVYQITGTGISEGQRFASISNNSYYLDPDGNSQLNTVDVDDYVRHRGDTNTYIGFPSDDTFAVTTFSSERMRITSFGKVGIGTTSPTNQLHVHTSTDNDYAIRIEGSTNNAAGVWTGLGIGGEVNNTKSAILFEDIGLNYSRGKLHLCVNDELNQNNATSADARLTVSNNGNVGIGTTSPDTILEVVDENPILTVRDTSTGLSSANSALRLAESGSGDTLGNYWDLKMKPESVGGTTNFAIANSSLGEVLNINYQGNVGIGTTPSVWGSGFLGLDLGGSAAANIGGISRTRINTNLYYDGTNYKYKTGFGGVGYHQDAVGVFHAWYTAPTGTAGANATLTERMRIGSAGQIGIGGANYGTSGQVLTSNGSASAPSWQTPAAGGITGVTAGSYMTGGGTSGTVTLNANASTVATANTLAARDSARDISARLFRSDYTNQSTISGAIAFRVNNGGDNYTRYCSSPSAIRTFIGALSTTGKAADSNLLDGKNHTEFGATLATYGTTAGSTGRIRCTAPFNTNSGKMFQVTVSIYSSYTIHNYVVSGYMYNSTNQWHSPQALYSGTGDPDIVVGRDSSGKAYISIANGNYAGVRVHNMTRGYYTSVADTYDPWTITITGGTENSVTPSIYETWTSGNDGPGSGLNADLLDNFQTTSSGNRWGVVPTVGDTGVTEVGKYIDFHESDASTSDYNYRITSTSGRLYLSGDLEVDGGDIYINDSNTRITEGANNAVRVQTNSGYVDIGAANTGYSHFYTDRPAFYFNKEVQVDTGSIRSHNEDLNLNRAGSSTARLRITSGVTYSDQYLLASGSLRAPLFYDSDNTNYYVNPASTSNLNALTVAGDITNSGGAKFYGNGIIAQVSSGAGGFHSNGYIVGVASSYGKPAMYLHGNGFTVSSQIEYGYANTGIAFRKTSNVFANAITFGDHFGNPQGSISVSGTTTTYNTTSDYRLKENVIEITDGIDRVKQLQPKRFNFISEPDVVVDGFIAHEAQEVVPEAVTGEKDSMQEVVVTPAEYDDEGNVITEAVMGTKESYQGIDQSKIVPLLTAALQDAITKIENLETRIQILENQ